MIETDPRRSGRVAGRTPRVLVIPAVVALALLLGPLSALLLRADWGTFWQDVTSPAALATVVCVLLGLPLAHLIARAGPGTAAVLRALVSVPLVLPPLVGGVALLYLLGRNGWLGQLFAEWWGWRIPFTPVAVVLAQVFVSLPFLVLSADSAISRVPAELEEMAADLGARDWTVLSRFTLPLAGPGILAGVTLCFARAMGEFGATAMFAGNAPGTTQTVPLAIYAAFNGAGVAQGTGIALSLLLFGVSLVALLLIRGWRPGGVG